MNDPVSDAQARVYQEKADAYDALINAEDADEALARVVREWLPEGAVALDVGAGTGRLSRIVGARASRLHLVDRAAPMLEIARRHLLQAGVPFTIHHADARSLPLPDASVDVAMAGWVFGHFRHWMPEGWREEVDAALAEMRRVVRPGGAIMVIETLGTGHETPRIHPGMDEYFAHLEHAHGLSRRWVRTDYVFPDVETAARICGEFFGPALVTQIHERAWARLPECTAIFTCAR